MKKIIAGMILLGVSCYGGQITQTTDTLQKLLDMMEHPFIQDVGNSVATNSITSTNAVRFTVDGTTRNFVSAPSYMTDRWDTVNNKIALPTEVNTPAYEATISFTFKPTAAAQGICYVRCWIDDTIPKLLSTRTRVYKATEQAMSFDIAWYLGTEAGYDAKNDGVYFTIEFEKAGDLYDKSISIYRR